MGGGKQYFSNSQQSLVRRRTEGLKPPHFMWKTNQTPYEVCTAMNLPNTRSSCCSTKRWLKHHPQNPVFWTGDAAQGRGHMKVEGLRVSSWAPSGKIACGWLGGVNMDDRGGKKRGETSDFRPKLLLMPATYRQAGCLKCSIAVVIQVDVMKSGSEI